jgi:2-polyprenyl-6-methoxyphenol hydroxylase-like FAD-dependent oxidoreductase
MVDDGDRNLARTAYLAFQYNRAYTYLPTDSGRAYFLGFFKNPAKTVNDAIPRYSDEDEVEDVAAHANDIIVPGLTFGDLYKRRTRSTLVPLQEYLLEKCFYKRVVLIGDAVHKV